MTAEGRIGLLGLGTVGGGVLRAIQGEPSEPLARAAGQPVAVEAILVRDRDKPRALAVEPDRLTTDVDRVVGNPAIGLVIEVLGGEHPAVDYIEAALRAGQHVVTANKEVIAKHGPRLFALAREHGVQLRFEASVGGGIPIMASLRSMLAANRVTQLRAIINGTTNYILTSMAELGQGFDEALAAAQELGYAEPDPTADIEGYDAVYKLAILATLCFGQAVHPDQIGRQGITSLTAADLRCAAERGYTIKLLAVARRTGDAVEARVAPVLVPQTDLLAGVRQVFNAAQIDGDLVGRLLLSGRGAGPGPTASAILGDVAAILAGGRADSLLAEAGAEALPVDDGGSSPARFYVRVPVVAATDLERARPFVISTLGPDGLERLDLTSSAGSHELVIFTGLAPAERADAVAEALRPLAAGAPTILRIEE